MASASLSILPKVAKLSANVTTVLGLNPSPMTLRGTNTYLIGGAGKRCILLDTGDGQQPEYFQNLNEMLRVGGSIIGEVILSHWHPDHVGGISKIIDTMEVSRVVKYPRTDGEETVPDNIPMSFIQDGHKFDLGDLTLRAYHTPGHTTDSIILHLEEENAIFSADTILGEGTAVFEDLHDYMLSLEKILALKPKVIYPGHGPIIQNPMEKIQFYIQHRNQRENQILETLSSKPNERWTAMDIVQVVYTETPKNLHLAASKNVTHHLQKLVKEGKVHRENGKVDSFIIFQ